MKKFVLMSISSIQGFSVHNAHGILSAENADKAAEKLGKEILPKSHPKRNSSLLNRVYDPNEHILNVDDESAEWYLVEVDEIHAKPADMK